MFVYFARHYTSKVSRNIKREIVCENCRTVYAFQATRTAAGHGTSAYMVNNQGARRRAQERAIAKLDAATASEVDLVPCPTCGWFQSGMVSVMRARKHRWAMPVGLTIALAGGLIAVILMSELSLDSWQDALLGWAGALSVIGGVGLILYARYLRMHFDPNADHAARAGRPQVGVSVVAASGQRPIRPAPVAEVHAAIEEPTLWHYAQNGQVAGPVAHYRLREMAARGQLRPTDLVWHDGLPDWVEAGSIDALSSPRTAGNRVAQPLPQAYSGSARQPGGLDWARPALIGGGIAVAICVAIALLSFLLYHTVSVATPVASNATVYTPPVMNPPAAAPVVIPPPVFTPPVLNFHPPVIQPSMIRPPVFRPPVFNPPMVVNSNPGWKPSVPSRHTAIVGGQGGGPYSLSDPQGRVVVGFRYEIGDWAGQTVVHSLDPLYDPQTAPSLSEDGKSGVLIGRPGYVVGGIVVDGRNCATAMQVIFIRENGGRRNPADQYTTDWLGTPIDGTPTQLAGHGERVIGICGRKGLNFDALGLVIASN